MKDKFSIRLLLLLGIAVLSQQTKAQITAPGFVQTDMIKQAGDTTDVLVGGLGLAGKQTTRVYYDGLGRTLQTVAVQASPSANDIIQPAAYDNLGRAKASYLPYAGASGDIIGSYRSNAVSTAQPAFYNQTSQYLIPVDTAPHMRQIYENSPLQRVLEAGTVGGGFQPGQHYKTLSYRPNTATDLVYMTGPNGIFSTSSYYPANSLWVTDGKDEDNVETLIFKDLAGRIILKRQVSCISAEPYYDTYYVYNNAGAIRHIVPPKATHLIIANGYTLATTQVANLIYTYVYNNLGLLISKKVPNAGTTSIIYDPLNRPVLTQDSNMVARRQWYYVKYDAKNRPVSSGIFTYTSIITGTAMQTYVSGQASYSTYWYETRSTSATNYYYTNNVFPNSGITPLTYNYYDNYDYNGDGVYDYAYKPQTLPTTGPEGQAIPVPVACTDSLKGLPTMTLKYASGPGFTTPRFQMTVTFYDRYGHVIQQLSNNHVNYAAGVLTDIKTVAPDFTGKPIATQITVVTGTGTTNTNTILTTFNYGTNNDRLRDVDMTYNGVAKHIANYAYNELGQVTSKNLGATAASYLQTVDYRYNIRGQLTTINNSTLSADAGKTNNNTNDLFGMQLMYESPDANISSVTASYSGRLSAVKWMSRDGSNNLTNERSYAYHYDQLGRDTSSIYAERTTPGSGLFGTNKDGFDENGITYDDGGNITKLQRTSSSINATSHTLVDNLTYGYDSTKPNQLNTVSDATSNALGFNNATGSMGSYTYDNDGNLVTDPFKGLNLKYNNIGKVDSIVRTATGTNGAYISYTYDATGTLLRKQVYSTSTTLLSTTDYIDGFVYNTASGASLLSYLPMPEGRLVNTSSTTVALTPEYVISDQQGNARFSFEDNGSGAITIRQENSYYAFGEVLANSPVAIPTTPNKNLYNGGSEWQNDFNNLPDYHQTFFRNYDPAIGRFIGVDPMPESAESMTGYQYAGNNPVMANDPMGNLAHGSQPYYGGVSYGFEESWAPVSGGIGSINIGGEEVDEDAYIDGLAASEGYAGGPSGLGFSNSGGQVINLYNNTPSWTGAADNAKNTTGKNYYFYNGKYMPDATGSNGTNENSYNNLTPPDPHNDDLQGTWMELSESDGLAMLKANNIDISSNADAGQESEANETVETTGEILENIDKVKSAAEMTSLYTKNGVILSTSEFLEKVIGASGGNYIPLISAGINQYKYSTKQISTGQYYINQTGVLGGIIVEGQVGGEFGGPWGAAAGLGFGITYQTFFQAAQQQATQMIQDSSMFQPNFSAPPF